MSGIGHYGVNTKVIKVKHGDVIEAKGALKMTVENISSNDCYIGPDDGSTPILKIAKAPANGQYLSRPFDCPNGAYKLEQDWVISFDNNSGEAIVILFFVVAAYDTSGNKLTETLP